MAWRRLVLALALLAATAAGKGNKKHRHHKPGRALLDRLHGTPISAGAAVGSDGDLLPAPLDVAPFATVTANASCGDYGAEEYCRDTPGKRVVVCDICEGPDGPAGRRHPASHAVDGDPATWWQSPTLAVGEQYRNVELVATLPEKMELLHVIIKAGPSPRPLAWSLEVSPSQSGDDWRLVRAFGDREHCRRLWDLRPERRRRKARAAKAKRINRADKATCSTQFVSPKPLENGEMHVGMGEGVWAVRARISFRAAHAGGRQHYYSVRALTLAARCLCHGHAEACRVTGESAKCSCEHGTCGTHCQRCCDGGPWAPHSPCTALEGTGIQGPVGQEGQGWPQEGQCACAGRGACVQDQSGDIICVNCTDNRSGPWCDRCLDGYYSRRPDGPCEPCDCDPDGSDGTCTYDSTTQESICTCLPGFGGRRCDVCSDPRAEHPRCEEPRCRCDPRGIVDPERICDDVCECKAHVVGIHCDACAAGYFGLSELLPAGCRRCYCSHVADSCALAAEEPEIAAMEIPVSSGWLVADSARNETLEPTLDDHDRPYIVSYEVEGWPSFYWVSSTGFRGLSWALYGLELRARMSFAVMRGDTAGAPSIHADVALVAADGTRLYYGNRTYAAGDIEVAAPIVEGEWYRLGGDAPAPVTRGDLLDVLRDLREVMVRAHFHGDQDEVRLDSVSLRPLPLPSLREQCACPAGRGGPRCGRCAWGHAAGAAGGGPPADCVPCGCNGHAECETADGPCGPCQHNTTGPRCERCLPGHYGNPVQGSCKPCACPLFLSTNNFSPNCALAAAAGDAYVCTQCPDGYAGDHCEICDFGYYGSPTTPGGSCQPCECGGAACRSDTGDCIACPPHAEGARCDQCQEGYWAGPTNTTVPESGCVACECGSGAAAAACDARGRCGCRAGYGGDKCDTCGQGHGDVLSGCPPCQCGVAARGGCDAATGECACAPGAAPPRCHDCLEEFYGVHEGGCLGCNCSSLGAESNVCDIRSGQCRCRPHVTGRACDICEEGYWGLQLGGCRPCLCGAGAAACDPNSGACACADGVGGARCDTCLQGYYGFGPAGCLRCPSCPAGKVCSPLTGRCVCPGRARGAGCRQCARGYWRDRDACRQCRCGPGAVGDTCDPTTGACTCRAGWAGARCDACAAGHHGPRCRRCECDVAGTLRCGNGTCACDVDGRCACKENVIGDKCDACLDGTFGLSAANPAGCTACFCFGRAARCEQAKLTRAALRHAVRTNLTLVVGDTVEQMDRQSLLAVHTHAASVTIPVPAPVPVYLELDQRFGGDRVTSYGGALRFTVREEGGEELPADVRARFPLVRLYAKDLVLDYVERVPPINGTHVIILHESLWAVHAPFSARADRAALMLTLQTLDTVMLRASTRTPTSESPVLTEISNISLDTTMPGSSRSAPALGVEVCACPSQYASESCQIAAPGFYLPPPTVRLREYQGTIVITLDGQALACRCNGRADKCDPVTGHCLNCTSGTGGPHCESCAAGHHGSPAAPAGCQPCPCPSRARNFADACAYTDGILRCLCKPGYTGPECESCAPGYVRTDSGACQPCQCSPSGSLSPHCDAYGRCRCRPQVTGDKCDQCLPRRTYLSADGCLACDNCTQTLLDSIEALTLDLSRSDLTELSRIPQPFPALLEFAHNATMLRTSLLHIDNEIHQESDITPLISELEHLEHKIFTEANRIKTEASRKEAIASVLATDGMNELEEVLSQRRKINEVVTALNDFAKSDRHLSAHKALKEARHLYRQINDINLIEYIAAAEDVADLAELQSSSIGQRNDRIEDTSRRLQDLREGIERWKTNAEDLRTLGDIVWRAGDAVDALQKRVRPKMAAIRDIGVKCRLILEDITNLNPRNLTEQTQTAIVLARALTHQLTPHVQQLKALAIAAEEKEGILYNLLPTYRKKYLEAAEEHVKRLGEKAKEYKGLFAGTRLLATDGVTAARAWTEVADAVHAARALATHAAHAARAAIDLARGSAMLPTARDTVAASQDLKAKGTAVLSKAEELVGRVSGVQRLLDVVRVSLRALGWQQRALDARPAPAAAAELARSEAVRHAERVFATTRALYDEASEARRRGRYALRRQLLELQRHGDAALGAAQEHVSAIRGNTVRGAMAAAALAAAAEARAAERAAAVAPPALAALRDTVARARHAAASISVSLTSLPGGAGCARAYAVPAAAGSVTALALALSFDKEVRDGPLVYLGDDSEEQEKYLKMWVESGKLQVAWQLGGGGGLLQHPAPLRAAHDDTDHTSYRIVLHRVWNTVELSVERAGSAAITATNSSVNTAVSLTGSRLWLGWPGSSTGLPGCVHSLQYQDQTVGLWNFVEQPAEAMCTGCTQRWYSSAGGDGLVWLNGAGYAALRRSSPRAPAVDHFSLAFTFRTRDRDALLFMARDTVNNRSVSVYLRACRVVLAVEYGGGARLRLSAGGAHCRGRPARVQAIRAFTADPAKGTYLERGSLRVNGEETLGSPEPPVQSHAALPDLSTATYWVGGAPPGADEGGLPPPLLGCIGALSVDREGYNLMDTTNRHGIEPKCGTRTLRSAVFEGAGFIELAAPTIRRKAALGLTFRARAPTGTLLARARAATDNDVDAEDDDDKHYLVVGLDEGAVTVSLSAGKGELRLRSNGSHYAAGDAHTIRLTRHHKQVELWIDSQLAASGTIAGNALPARAGGLYIGGPPTSDGTEDHTTSDAPTTTVNPGPALTPFTGTIADVIVDNTLLGLESAVRWSGAWLGRADAFAAAPLPRALHATPLNTEPNAGCSKSASFAVEAGAVKFGDAAHSHAWLRLRARRALALALHFRTLRPDGLLLLIPGPKLKPKHYTALLIRGGQLRLVIRGRRRKETSLPANVSDGTWRSVSIRISGGRGTLQSGGAAATVAGAAARAQRLYVGGLPAPPALPNVPNSIVRIGGLVGCVRRVRSGGRGEDLARAAAAHRVGQCFPHVQPGAYFAGDAYATWSLSYPGEGGGEAAGELRLQFRTTEPNGVLLATKDLVLEIVDGVVTLSRHWGRESLSVSTGALACDGHWHSVRAIAARGGGLVLALDGGAARRAAPADTLLADADAPAAEHALYVGGLPEGTLDSDGGKENFKGCIRDVSLGGRARDWREMHALHNVLLDSCPAAAP